MTLFILRRIIICMASGGGEWGIKNLILNFELETYFLWNTVLIIIIYIPKGKYQTYKHEIINYYLLYYMRIH